MKVALELGVTLNLGNYNSARASIRFEDEYAEKEVSLITAHAEAHGFDSNRETVMRNLADDLYSAVEAALMEKVASFISRLEDEKLI